MKCKTCGFKSDEHMDFLGKEDCFKCQYAKKLKDRKAKCKWCNEEIPSRKRWKYCSADCAKEGAKFLKRNYWTNKVSSQNLSWHENNRWDSKNRSPL